MDGIHGSVRLEFSVGATKVCACLHFCESERRHRCLFVCVCVCVCMSVPVSMSVSVFVSVSVSVSAHAQIDRREGELSD